MANNGLSSLEETPSKKTSLLENTWCYSKAEVIKASLIWRISNFSFFSQQPGTLRLQSEYFSAAVDNNIKWILQLYLNFDDKSINMVLTPSKYKTEVRAQCRFVIYDRTMKEAKVVSKSYCFYDEFLSVTEFICYQSEVVAPDKKILSNDQLTIGCKVKFLNDYINSVEPIPCSKFIDPKPYCVNILEHMFKNQELSDVKINIGECTFDAHKAILAAASPVFLAMFKSNMTETEQNFINIDDMDEETFKEMLCYIYTGNVNNIENVADTLFAAADKYAVDMLKHECEKQLCNSLTVENAVRVLILADLHNSDWLKAQVMNFIKLELIGVIMTTDFNSMIDSHRYLLDEIINALALK